MTWRPTTTSGARRWSLVFAAAASPAAFAEDPAPAPTDEPGEVIDVVDRPPIGARGAVTSAVLERTETDDAHAALGRVAGVYVRDEDGFGLRPNIGMRGAPAERSAKVTILEDGVLIGPAPYTAPAAYYFPLVTRMASIEVTKGPAAIVHGPSTVGGIVDLHGAAMAGERAAMVDLAGGTHGYGKLHGRATERGAGWGAQGEVVYLRSGGFKELDGGGPTGFAKRDAQLWLRRHSPASAAVYHQLDLKAGWSDEVSDETYTGLTDADLRATPDRRYLGTARDRMVWDHLRLRATHTIEDARRGRLEVVAYRHVLDRVWGKLDGFIGESDLGGVLARPETGSNAVYYAVLTGAADSAGPEEELLFGENDRRFVSQGVQARGRLAARTGAVTHAFDLGARVHFDRADRRRFESAIAVMDGALVDSARPRALVLDTRAESTALALHAQDRLRRGPIELGVGARAELVTTRFADRQTDEVVDLGYQAVVPGGGVAWDLTPEVTALAGVHRGFSPVAPGQDARPETSLNYEAGARWRSTRLAVDALGFFADYTNLKGTCTQSSGCEPGALDDEFDAGAVWVWGAELQVAAELDGPRLLGADTVVPIEASYTYSASSFRRGFDSSFPGWGEVERGDALPYLPAHQGHVAATWVAPRWEVGVAVRHRGAARDVAGQGEVAALERVDASTTVDASVHARPWAWGELYLTGSNLLDERALVARRPYGARPSAPRHLVLGVKGHF